MISKIYNWVKSLIPFPAHHDKDGRLHKNNGPALVNDNGVGTWYQHGQFHRYYGPVEVWSTTKDVWFIHGRYIR